MISWFTFAYACFCLRVIGAPCNDPILAASAWVIVIMVPPAKATFQSELSDCSERDNVTVGAYDTGLGSCMLEQQRNGAAPHHAIIAIRALSPP